MRSPVRVFFFAMLFLSALAPMGFAQPAVVINEIMASNSKTLADPQKQYDDWIEFYNPGDTYIDLGGMYLTDDLANPAKWQFPMMTFLPAKGYLVLWADGDVQDSGLHAGFSLSGDGEELGLFASDGQTLVDSVTFGPQICDVSYGRCPDATGTWRYMGAPSPGSANIRPSEGIVAGVEFSHDRGFYDAPFDVTLTCPTPGATIYYTLDGGEPANTSGGIVYTSPIRITRTTCLRATAAKLGWLPSRTDTRTYIFLSDVVTQPVNPAGFPATWASTAADYQMDPDITNAVAYSPLVKDALLSLPTLSIVMNTSDLFGSNGIYANPSNTGPDWERPASVELIDPNGQPGFQINGGIQIQGGAFRTMSPKHSLRLVFKSLYGATKLRYPLFGEDAVDEFETVTLRAGANDGYSWSAARNTEQYIRDEFGRDLQRATGNVGSHGIFVHLYLNGLYWGLYNPCERPDASFSASYYGGQKEDWDAVHSGRQALEAVDGNLVVWNQMLTLCRAGLASNDAYQRLQGNNPDGTRNPAYPHFLDVPEYIDYLIVNIWGGNWDWPWKNWYTARDRTANSTGFKFYCWDFENTMGNNLDRSPLNKNALNNNFSSAGEPHQYLKLNTEYQLLFADHVHRFFFNHGVLTPESLIPRYTALADTVELAIIGESARWGDQHIHPPLTLEDWLDSDTNYGDGRAGRGWILNYYLPQRTGIVLQQLKNAGLYPNVDAPVFYIDGAYQHGGHVASGAALSMQATAGTIWYTLDGSDPRMPGAGSASNAQTLVAENASKKVLVPTAAIGDAWRGGAAFDDSAWTSGTGGVGYERSTGYESYFSINVQSQMYSKNGSCYIRIPFTVAAADVGKLSTLTLNVRCDDGFIAYLNGVEAGRKNFNGTPAWNSRASTQTQDIDAIELQPFDVSAAAGKLVAGQNLLAIQALNDSLTSSDFLMSVTLTAAKGSASNPSGVSPTAVRYTTPITLPASTGVKARALSGTTWSALNEAVYAVGPVAQNLRISEIMYHPLDPNTEYVELTNVGAAPIHLNRVKFTKGIDFTFADMELAPKAFTVIVEDLAAFGARYGDTVPVAGQYTGNLSNGGERIEIQDAVGGVIEDFRYSDGWYDLTDGMGYSLTARTAAVADPNAFSGAGAWRPSAQGGGSPGYDDSSLLP